MTATMERKRKAKSVVMTDPKSLSGERFRVSPKQLDALGQELQVGTAGAKTKTAKVTIFLNAPKTLKLPKSLRSIRGKRKGGE